MDTNSNPGTSNKALRWIVILVVLAIAGGFFFLSQRNSSLAPVEDQNQEAVGSGQPASSSDVVTFEVEGGMFYFTPKEIAVKKGQTVRIVFKNKEGMHDWVVDEFNARTPVIKGGETSTIEFVADKAGTFEFYCSVGQHRQMGMKGNLVVSE